jgi:hypothetical protein
MITLKTINDKTVKKIYIPEEDTRPIKGVDLCPEVFSNIFLCAKKKSGKTSAIFTLLKNCAGKDTVIIVFCSTIYKDSNWIEIRKYFEKKGSDIRVFTSIYEDGEDQLEKLINELSEEAKEKEGAGPGGASASPEQDDDNKEDRPEVDRCDEILEQLRNPQLQQEQNEEKKRKPKKCKYQSPEYIIVFDDLSTELKAKSLLSLMKKNRHFKTKLIISSQWVHDLLPESRKQLDLWLIFKGFPEAKMIQIHRDCDSGLPFELFYKMYKKATKYPYSFFFIDTREDSYRRNFNQKFLINNPE